MYAGNTEVKPIKYLVYKWVYKLEKSYILVGLGIHKKLTIISVQDIELQFPCIYYVIFNQNLDNRI